MIEPDVDSARLVLRSMTPAFLSASWPGVGQIDGLLGLAVADGYEGILLLEGAALAAPCGIADTPHARRMR